MSDWSDEVEARLEEELDGLNQRSMKSLHNDIRAVLGEIKRSHEEARLNRAAAEKHYAYGEAQKERAEAAEAERDRYNRMCGALEANLAEMTDAYLEDHAKVGNRDSALDALRTKLAEAQMELSDARHSLAHCVPGRQAALAEVERLRKALEDERSGKAKAERARNAEASALRGGGE